MLKWGGRYDEKRLETVAVPQNAVEFTINQSNTRIFLYAVFMTLLAVIAPRVRFAFGMSIRILPILIGMVLSLALLPVHELIHSLCYPKGTTVFAYRHGLRIELHSTAAISKQRFIVFLLMPVLVLGMAPLLIWFCLPSQAGFINGLLYGFSFSSIGMSIGDIVTLVTVIRTIPKGYCFVASGTKFYFYDKQLK